ncbi:MAG: DNA polymerase III subunit gamma/tau [Candidatus Contendobacter sp.]|jgi:DNA polymerase-3 subunit gamma/tau|nr:DNA polymerase III subunit gamma/tau [Gammaproteobacteria bacterium]MCC8992391.1 DNA polymerase III subunit gamma/tau [Candidatus Contendobacter sp.]
MSYQVLARKWRPRTFHQLAGQEHVVRALTNALDQQRLHHAFLFTGTRGVGKTTIARIFAKSLNCETGVSSKPCGECSACVEIDAGRFVDLIEVDAASRTGVDDTRELLENVQYAPSRGRFKVYLIDEVHMFSRNSFNALLKTLEEPPPHVKFLLATTDPQKLPVTVLSRCLQFNLKRLPTSLIAGYLNQVLEREVIAREEEAVRLIARAGDGSMRDALSLLDQAIAFGGGRVEAAAVSAMLGSIDRRRVVGLLEALVANDAPTLLQRVAELDELSPDYAAVLAALLLLLQQVALAQMAPEAALDEDLADPEDLRRLAGVLPPEDVQLFYQIALLGRRDLPLNPDARGGFEMALLRMLCFRPATVDAAARTPVAVAAPHSSVVATLRPVPAPAAPIVAPVPLVQPTSEWGALVAQLSLVGIPKQVAMNCVLTGWDGDTFLLTLEPGHAQMLTKTVEDRIRAALEQHLGKPVNLKFQTGAVTAATPASQQKQQQADRRQAVSEQAVQDPYVREMQDTFGAQIVAIHPLDDADQS